ncbi:acyl-CoA dehydrogenase family protein [Candidatus Blastococcus massiliensis]|uniref:acyl-CoA dehydrogenase family protein n=1 Tax=Candidatus Blastococcus massiliensis TaxID=1470358 RepID=UPI0009DE0C31|nr:acyl-CoA dehydrogenase family protein [Candidatus Blastococcus massiliensis]
MQFDKEQEELRRTLRRFLETKSSSEEVRRLMETEEGYDPAVWSQMAEQLGLQGLAIPEEYGGSGFSILETALVAEEMGRALLPAPYLATVLAANLLQLSTDEQAKADLLPGIAEGTTIATVALAEAGGQWTAENLQTRASGSGDAWTLDGQKSFVLDGHTAGLLLVVAQAPGGPSVFAVEGSATGLDRRALQTLDMTRKLAEVTFAGTPARLVGSEGDATALVPKLMRIATVVLAAEQVGGAQRCLERTVEYVNLRYQFGRPVGSFQAVKHRCADMLLEVESARSAAYYALWALAEDADDAAISADLAKAFCSEAYWLAASDSIQLHGGIAFTWEHDAHLYYRRAKSTGLLFGTPTEHWDAVAEHLLA